jgi:hypothetical protein
MIDSLSNYLIFFALPEAKQRNEGIIRALFDKDRNSECFSVTISLFEIEVLVDCDEYFSSLQTATTTIPNTPAHAPNRAPTGGAP